MFVVVTLTGSLSTIGAISVYFDFIVIMVIGALIGGSYGLLTRQRAQSPFVGKLLRILLGGLICATLLVVGYVVLMFVTVILVWD